MSFFNKSLAVVAMMASAVSVLPCAGAYRNGEEAYAEIERVVIVWNPRTETQHFARQITFKGKGKDFGFFVPTPTRPSIEEVDPRAFSVLAPVVLLLSQQKGGLGGGVEVLERKMVAGFDTAILKAKDASSLEGWLRRNDYPTRPALTDWFSHYTRNDCIINAFKILRDENATSTEAKAVRLSFSTGTPFYPYREPLEPRPAGYKRKLEIMFIGPERVRAVPLGLVMLGKNALDPVAHGKVQPDKIEQLASALKLKPEDFPKDPVHTWFVDQQVQRPDYDLLFVR
jgi:hypothetical protein